MVVRMVVWVVLVLVLVWCTGTLCHVCWSEAGLTVQYRQDSSS